MKETLKYIGRWVIRFILMSIIFSTFQSCAKAYTFDEFVAFSETVAELEEADTDTHLSARWLVSNADRIKSELSSTINNFDTFVVWYSPSINFYRFIGFQGGTFTGWKYSATSSIMTSPVSYNGRTQINGTWYRSIDGRNSTYRYGLFSEDIADTIDFTGRIGNNYYSTFDMQFNHTFSSDYNYNGETIQTVQLNYNNSTCFIEEVINIDGVTTAKAYLDENEIKLNDLRTILYNFKIPKIKRTKYESSIYIKG